MSQRMIYLKDETREKILIAAEKLVMKVGVFDLQMQDVAKKALVSRNTLYRYYQDKGHLAFHLMSRVLKRVIASQGELIPKIKSIKPLNIIREYFQKVWMNPQFDQDMMFLAEFDAYYSGVRQIEYDPNDQFGYHYQEENDFLYMAIKEGQKDGSIRKDRDAHLLAVTSINAFRSLHNRMLLRSESLLEIRDQEKDNVMDCILDLLIQGLKGD